MHSATGTVSTRTNKKTSLYFARHLKILKIFGISFTGDESLAYKIYSIVIILTLNVLHPILGVIDYYNFGVLRMSNYAVSQFATTVGILKTLKMIQNRHKFGQILFKLEEKPFTADKRRGGEEEQKLLDRCNWIINTQATIYWTVSTITITVMMLYVVFKRIGSDSFNNWDLSHGPLAIINGSYSPNYELLATYQQLAIASMSVHFTTIDLVTAGALTHICYQLKILQNNLRRAVRNSYAYMLEDTEEVYPENEEIPSDFDVSTIPWKYLKSSLKQIVSYHLDIIDLADKFESVVSNLLLSVFLTTLGMMCFAIYCITTLKMEFFERFKMVGEGICATLQVAMVCYWGEEILAESGNVGEAIYETNFVGVDLRFQNGLILIIRRSHNLLRVTAGGFTNIGLYTFFWIMKTSYSAFMILRNKQE